jgi:multidrug efflux pump subunit AcrB
VRATRAYLTPGKLEFELDFDSVTRPDDDLYAVREAVDRVRPTLPAATIATTIEGPDFEPVLTYAITSASMGQAELDRTVEAAARTVFVGTPHLARITVFGGPRVAYEVVLEASRLARLRVGVSDVAGALSAALAAPSTVQLVRGDERLFGTIGEGPRDAAGLGAILVGTPTAAAVPLRELARISYGTEATDREASFDATPAVLLNVYPTARGDAVALASATRVRVAALRRALPSDAKLTVAWDQTRLILASQRALAIEMVAGAVVALGIVAWFLRDVALVVASATVLALAVTFTLAIDVLFGERLDLMTLGGIAIAIGLVVDETIVVVEALARGSGIGRVAKPLLLATAANVVAFAPLAFLGGVPGFFFRALAITVATALVVSVGLSLAVAPMLATMLRARARTVLAGRAERAYVTLLRRCLRYPATVLVVTFAMIVLSVTTLSRSSRNFLPEVTEGQFEIKYALPPGTSLRSADDTATRIERTILLDRSVAGVARLSGVDTNGYLATPPDAGTIRVTLAARAARESFDLVADRMRDAVANVAPYAAVEVHQLLEDEIDDLSGTPEPIQLTVRGPAQATLNEIAEKLADRITGIPGIVDVFDGVTWQARRVVVTSRAPGGSSGDFARDVQARTAGLIAGDVAADDGPVPVVVRVADGAPLSRYAKLGKPQLVSDIEEDDGVPTVRVTAGLENADLSTTAARIRARTADIVAALPPGCSVTLDGATVAERAAFSEFGAILAVAATLIFGVLAIGLRSFRLPLTILAAIPLGSIGVAIALAVTRTTLNVASAMGTLLLAGIVVRNAILLVDSATRFVRDGLSTREAVEQAAVERLRPIVMTTLAGLGALAPLAFAWGSGAEFDRPLAIAVIGGLVTSTALTLAIVPLLYVIADPRRDDRSERGVRLR